MPYTPAHAIVAAPLWYGSKKKLSLPALVIGCMAPDLPYLAHLAPVSSPGHTPLGLITHAVPQGLVLFAIWDVWLEKPILSLVGLRPSQHEQSWIGYFSVVLSLWLGAASHALLDATSHETGWFVQNFSLLTSEIGPLPLFKWIQYGGGIAGLAAIAVWYRHVRQRRYSPPQAKKKVFTISLIFIIPMVVFAGVANILHQSALIHGILVYSATGIMTGFLVGACIYSAIARLWPRYLRRRN